MVGKTVQQYQFLEKLGAGGMGEIFRAQDTRLNRFVAIKVLSNAATSEPERRRRFIQEAQAASALNHPNIITIHDIISEGDAEYMVMEHVVGKTLGDLIPKGGLRVPQVLKLGLQMTDALNAAHSAGIVHRDLKPGNVMVTESGLVKVLDFGLAKLTQMGPITAGPDDETRTIADRPLTVEGSIIGTVSYMSPEQAQGRKVDTRSDVFSMGVVFYEMITGDRAFQGDTAIATLSAILRDNPRPFSEVAPDVPQQLEDLIWKCLRKSPDDRYQTMRDVHLAMGALKQGSDSGILYRSSITTSLAAPSVIAPLPSNVPSSITQVVSPAGGPSSSAPQSVMSAPQSGARLDGPGASKASSKTPMLIGAVALLAVVLGAGIWFANRPISPEVAQVTLKAVEQAQQPTAPVPPPVNEEILTNDSIIQLWQAKIPLPTIFGQLRTAETKFNLSAAEVIRLTKAGVPGSVIEAMRDPKNAAIPVAPVDAKGLPVADAGSAQGKTPDKGPEKAPAVPAGGKQLTLPNGTPFTIILSADIPDNMEQGAPLRFTTKEDIRVGDSVVIAKGASVSGEIAQGAKKGLFGGARLTMKLLSVEAVDGRKYSVRALASRNGDGKAERRVETNVKPKSKDVEASAGTEYVAYADGDLLISVRK